MGPDWVASTAKHDIAISLRRDSATGTWRMVLAR